MTNPNERLIDLIDDLTTMARKGPQRVDRDVGKIHVTEIFDMPPVDAAPSDALQVDVHFVVIVVDPLALERRAEIIAAIEASAINLDRLRDGPSYIEVGAALGDQGYALRLFGLGEALGLWRVITPARLGFDGPEADKLAGTGYVMTSGYHPEPSSENTA